ncbi:protein phosphatase 1 regulatory subunit 26 [Pelodytes ibericus]
MFLVNAPPLVAFKTKWAPFGQPATCRIPVCFSESEEEVSGTSITSKVQGIITSLQSDESSLDVTGEYECIMQKNRKGETHIDRGLKVSTSTFKGHSRESATLVVPAQFKDNKEENCGCGSLTLDSDSDDSVDRGIEEAIQEYLKERGTADPPPITDNAKSFIITNKERDLQKDTSKNSSVLVPPAKTETAGDFSDGFKGPERSRCASPESVSSDDSFEQSIKDEIEQFLHEKKQQNLANEAAAAKKSAQGEAAVKPNLKASKTAEKQIVKQGSRELAGKAVPEYVGTQSTSQKAAIERTRPKANVTKQNKNMKLTAQEVSSIKEELSDSSSDDGIEEAIQLYQLEKSRQENNLKVALNTASELVKTVPEAALNCIPCPDKTISPDSSTKLESRKRKLPVVKPPASQNSPNCQAKRASSVGDDSNTKCESASQATCRAETAAELMCAEAILDISKTILPSQLESTFTVLPANASAHCQADSDSSVDSDDSIEQEIRAFLARRAEAEKPAGPVQPELPPPAATTVQPEHDSQSLVSKSKLSLTQKRKTNEDKPVMQEPLPKGTVLETVTSNFNSRSELSKQLLPTETVQNSCMRTGTYVVGRSKLLCSSEAAGATGHDILDKKRLGLSQGPGNVNMPMRRSYSGDESSSLDSDEDLDTAIKDLLKSKKKCKKRVKDTRSPCKKRVRFGESTSKPLESCDVIQREPCILKAPVKSCLVSSKENALRRSKSASKPREEKEREVGTGTSLLTSSLVSGAGEPKLASASDKSEASIQEVGSSQAHDSSSVDSDDSIEQEIRKFLAERARESAELTVQKVSSTVTPEMGKIAKKVPEITEAVIPSAGNTTSPLVSTQQPAALPKLADCKQSVTHLYHRSADVGTGTSPIPRKDCLIVKQECYVAQSNLIKPSDKCLQSTPGRVLIKTEMNGSQGKSHLPVAGNFVAGLKYISGNEKQLVLNVGNTTPSRLAGSVYKPGQLIPKQTGCQSVPNKGLLLEKPKIVQASVAPKSPLVRPGLYLLTTQVCKDNASLCLPINTAQYDTGLNLMSIQYCHGQLAPRASPSVVERSTPQPRSGEIRAQIPNQAGELAPLSTPVRDSRPSHAHEAALETDCTVNVAKHRGNCSPQHQECRRFSTRIDPGMAVQPYIILSPEKMCNRFGLRSHLRTNPQQGPDIHLRPYLDFCIIICHNSLLLKTQRVNAQSVTAVQEGLLYILTLSLGGQSVCPAEKVHSGQAEEMVKSGSCCGKVRFKCTQDHLAAEEEEEPAPVSRERGNYFWNIVCCDKLPGASQRSCLAGRRVTQEASALEVTVLYNLKSFHMLHENASHVIQ